MTNLQADHVLLDLLLDEATAGLQLKAATTATEDAAGRCAVSRAPADRASL